MDPDVQPHQEKQRRRDDHQIASLAATATASASALDGVQPIW
jgi:hypothetical protein